MQTAVIKNEADHERTFLGMDVTLMPEEQVIDRDDYSVLIKNCVNFQQMTNPPSDGGEPIIRVLGSTPDGSVRVNAKGLGEPTLFTAPRVKLRPNDTTNVPKNLYDKLESDNRFQRLMEAGDIKFVEWEEK